MPIWVITVVTLAIVLVGVAIAYRMYGARSIAEEAPTDVTALTVAARRDLYGDAFNEAAFMRPGQELTHAVVVADERGIDGVVEGSASAIGAASKWLRGLQTGVVRTYALSMFAGAAFVIAAMVAVVLW